MASTDRPIRLADLDPAMLERYDLTGPRYTSYPTAPEWDASVGPAETRAHLADQPRDPTRPLSLYVHVPFCHERCTFCACNVIVSRSPGRVSEPYLDLLERELDLLAGLVDTRRPVVQLHLGGGTPTYLTAGQLRRLHRAVAGRFRLAPAAEQSIEIHVTWTSEEQIVALADLGFNRLSFGIQDFNPVTMAAIGRRQSYDHSRLLVETARAAGFTGLNLDLIYGLPHQSAESFAPTLERTLELGPDRLALYNFAYLPARMPHQRRIDPASLPSGPEKLRTFLTAHDRLTAAGFRFIGMDHFARPGDELARAFAEATMQRNFMGFTTRAGADLLGLGVSSISNVDGMYAQNEKKLSRWRAGLEAGRLPTARGRRLTAEDRLRRDVISALMCRDRLEKRSIEAAHGIRFDEHFAAELARLEPLAADGLLRLGPDALELTFLGRLFVRNIAMVFDAYLARRRGDDRPMFSKTL